MACETAGGSGVGPAVIRYCLVNGFGVMRERPLSRGEVARRLATGLEVAAELLEVQAGGDEDAPDTHADHAEDDADDPEDEPGVGDPVAGPRVALSHLLAPERARDPGGDR